MLVTGGTSGIGRTLAEAFHDRGNQVIVAGRRQALLDEVTAARPGMVGLRLDLDDQGSIQRLGAEVHARFPALNVLVANAGISEAEDVAAGGWDSSVGEMMVQTNITGVLRQFVGFLPMLKGKPGAAVMTTTSNLAFVPRAVFPTYCASKSSYTPTCNSCAGSCAARESTFSKWHPVRRDRAERQAPGDRPACHAARRVRGGSHNVAGGRRPSWGRGSGEACPRRADGRAGERLRYAVRRHEPGLNDHDPVCLRWAPAAYGECRSAARLCPPCCRGWIPADKQLPGEHRRPPDLSSVTGS